MENPMSDSNSHDISTSSPSHPDARRVDDHLVIDRRELVPGKHPEPRHRHESQTEYLEHYFRCIQCGIEVLNESDLPPRCEENR